MVKDSRRTRPLPERNMTAQFCGAKTARFGIRREELCIVSKTIKRVNIVCRAMKTEPYTLSNCLRIRAGAFGLEPLRQVCLCWRTKNLPRLKTAIKRFRRRKNSAHRSVRVGQSGRFISCRVQRRAATGGNKRARRETLVSDSGRRCRD